MMKNLVISNLLLSLCGFVRSEAAAADLFSEVRPIFEQHCVKCHGPEKQKGGLRFDGKEGAFKMAESGEKPILPGDAKESRLLRLVTSTNSEEWMPPKGERLSAAEIEKLR